MPTQPTARHVQLLTARWSPVDYVSSMNVPTCPSCGDLNAVVADNERLDVKTFYCANCDHDWEELNDLDDPRDPAEIVSGQ
jgi:predicted RNA-binding Zn-ribbon protein involved in translation (DUF1610 family)